MRRIRETKRSTALSRDENGEVLNWKPQHLMTLRRSPSCLRATSVTSIPTFLNLFSKENRWFVLLFSCPSTCFIFSPLADPFLINHSSNFVLACVACLGLVGERHTNFKQNSLVICIRRCLLLIEERWVKIFFFLSVLGLINYFIRFNYLNWKKNEFLFKSNYYWSFYVIAKQFLRIFIHLYIIFVWQNREIDNDIHWVVKFYNISRTRVITELLELIFNSFYLIRTLFLLLKVFL